jgi:6-phosphogluconate dehydrogenase
VEYLQGQRKGKKMKTGVKKSDTGLAGLAVMGENLAMNMESKGFTVSVYNRTTQKVTDFINGRAKGKNIVGAMSLGEFVSQLEKPRKVFLMVKAGQAVDRTGPARAAQPFPAPIMRKSGSVSG